MVLPTNTQGTVGVRIFDHKVRGLWIVGKRKFVVHQTIDDLTSGRQVSDIRHHYPSYACPQKYAGRQDKNEKLHQIFSEAFLHCGMWLPQGVRVIHGREK